MKVEMQHKEGIRVKYSNYHAGVAEMKWQAKVLQMNESRPSWQIHSWNAKTAFFCVHVEKQRVSSQANFLLFALLDYCIFRSRHGSDLWIVQMNEDWILVVQPNLSIK